MDRRRQSIPVVIANLFGTRSTSTGGEYRPVGEALWRPPGDFAWPMQIPAVACAVNLLAGEMAALPVRVYRGSRYNKGEEDTTSRVSRMLAESWSPEHTSFMSRFRLFQSALLCGQGFAFVERGRGGTNLHVLSPHQVSPMRVQGRHYYEVHDPDGPDAFRTMEVERADMVEVTFIPDLDGVLGTSTLRTCSVAVQAALAATEYAGQFFEEGALPLMAVKADIQSEEERKGIVEKLRAAMRRMNETGQKYLTLPHDTALQQVSTDPQKAQLLETRQFAIEEIARCFSIPPSFLQDLRYGTYSNTAQADMSLAKHTLRRWAEQVEQELTVALFGRFGQRFVEFDMTGLLRGDFKSRAEALRALVTTGVFTPDEARRDLGLPEGPTEGSDEQFLQGAMMSLDQLSQETDEAAQPEPQPETEEEEDEDEEQDG